jgi:hypothetical protein
MWGKFPNPYQEWLFYQPVKHAFTGKQGSARGFGQKD